MKRLPELVDGEFWLPGKRPDALPGRLVMGSTFPRVEVRGELWSPWQYSHTAEDGSLAYTNTSAPEEPRAIHGRLRTGEHVTIMETTTRSRRSPFFDTHLAFHEVEGTYVIEGGHLDERTAMFNVVRIRSDRLSHWARLSGISASRAEDRSAAVVNYEEPPPVFAEVGSAGVRLSVRRILEDLEETIAAGSMTAPTVLIWESTEALNAHDIDRTVINPMITLLSLLYGEEARLTGVEVQENGSVQWYRIEHGGVCHGADETQLSEPILNLHELSGTQLGTWFEMWASLVPVPELIAATVKDSPSSRAIQNQLLELATAAEGIDRRLRPGERRYSQDQEAEFKEALSNLGASPVLDAVNGTLNHLHEPSYNDRLKELLSQTSPLSDVLVGQPNRWRTKVMDARNGFAHLFDEGTAGADLVREYVVLATSLRLLLTARLLKAVGVAIGDIEQGMGARGDLERIRFIGTTYLPWVYADQ